MKRLIITGPKQAVFEDVPLPECAADGLLIKTELTAVSPGTEIRVFRAQPVDEAGRFLHEHIPFRLPTVNGYSLVGRVLQAGKDVTGFKEGDRVFAAAPHQEYVSLPAQQAVKLPDSVPSEQAVFLSILEVAHIALRRAAPAPGETVAVVGQGVIGLSAVAFCSAFGLRTLAVDRNTGRLEVSRKMGADCAVSPDDADFNSIIEAFLPAGCDVALEAASSWSAVRTAMQLTRPEGRVVIVSRHIHPPDFNPAGHPFLGKKLALLTSYGYPPDGSRWDRARSIGLTLELLSRGKLNIGPLLTGRFDRRELPAVYERYERGDPELIGVVLDWV